MSFFLISAGQVTVIRSENKVIIEGEVYFVHVVKAGQTLYSISKAYEISETEIIKENPGVDLGLQIGQVLKIPVGAGNEIVPPVFTPPDTTYFHHSVKKGETMYSIARIYNIRIEELEKINPFVINHEISIGQLINIPQNKIEINPDQFTYHKVRRRETIFGIARMYNISEELLKKYNPELLIKFPKAGQTLKIPWVEKEIPVEVTTPLVKTDTLQVFGILNYDTAKIASNYKYYLDSMPNISDNAFNVAYLIPFNYRPFEEIVPNEEVGITNDDILNLNHESNPNDQMLSSRNFLEFMEGSLLAIDSLKNEGLSVNILFFDTQKSPTRIREILNSPQFQNIDLIIGPFYSFNVEIVSEFSRLHRIPMISPLSGEIGPIMNNPFIFQLNPGYKTEYDFIANYVSSLTDKNIVLIHGVDSQELIKYNYLKTNLIKQLTFNSPPDSQSVREIVYNHTSTENLSENLIKSFSQDKDNIVVIPETDEAFVSTVITQLYFQLKNYNISVVGLPHWNAFQNIDFIYFHKLSLSYFTPYYFSYDSANIKHFLKDFRNTFYAEPVTLTKKGGYYAFLGYDLSFYFLKIMNMYSNRFILHFNEPIGHELMNDFQFTPVGEKGGFENRSLVLVKFYEDLSIKAEPYEITEPLEIIESQYILNKAVPVE